MTRDETRFSPNVGSLYSFVETSGWTVNATNCSYYVSGGITSNYNWSFTGYSQLQWWENGTWHDLASEKSGTYSGYGDKVYDSMYDYFNRQYVNRTVRVGNYAHAYVNGQSTSATAYIEYIVPALPPNATTVTATRNSNTSVTLSWTEASGVKESVRIERSIDGSSFAEIATVSGSATSYTDNTTAADHIYTYRIRYYNQNAYGGYSSTSSVTMAPSAPTKITVARATSTNVNVTLTNPSSVATSIQWQVTYDGGSTWSSSTSVSGSPVRSFTASTNGGTVKIRVRNVNATGSSAWIVSDSVVTLVPPAPPTALEPSGIINLKYGTLTFRWKHNPLDGSAQTEAHLHYTVGNQTADVPISGTANTYTIDIHSQAPGASYSWKVRTKGADPSYSDWSSTRSGKLYAEPQIYFIAQNPPSTVTALPIPIEVGYSDPQFMACASASMAIKRDGRTVYTEPLTIGSSRLTGQITAAELLPEQGATYTVSVTARSGSTLESTTNTTFTVDYIEPTHGTVQVQNEPDTGYASLLATYDNHASDVTYSGSTNEAMEVDGAAIRALTIDGKSVQDGTPTPSSPVPIQVVGGANYFKGFADATTPVSTTVGVSFTMDAGVLYATGTATGTGYAWQANTTGYNRAPKVLLPAGTYTVCETTGLFGVRMGKAPSNSYFDVAPHGGSKTITLNEATELAFVPQVISGTVYNNSTPVIMISSGSEAQPYIPYGSIGLKVEGTNKADIENAIFEYSLSRGVTYTRNNDGSITASGTANSLGYLVLDRSSQNIYGIERGASYTIFTDAANVFPMTAGGGSTTSNRHVLVIPDSGNWTIGVGVPSGRTANETFHVWLVKGNVASEPYMPYVDSLTEIPLAGNVLASLPDGTKDVLTVDASGHVTLTKRTGNSVINGTTIKSESALAGTNNNGYRHQITKIGEPSFSNLLNFMSDRFKPSRNTLSGNAWEIGDAELYNYSATVNFLAVLSNNESTVSLGNTWFASNNATVYYELATAQTVDLGYITMPELADGCTVEVLASLSTPLSMVSYDGLADAESISVIRVNKDGSRTQLADHAANYTAIVDKYAPLNTAYVYEVVTYAASGAYAVEITPNLLETTRWFAYWGENNIAWAQWNPSGSYTLSRPEKKRVHYAGRKWPVSYDSKAMEQSHSMTWTVVDMDDWQNGFIDLMNDGGRGVYKGCDGWVFHADFEYSATPQYTSITRMGDMSLTISRIDGEQL